MKSWTLSSRWHILHGKLTQKCARLMASERLYVQGKEEELVGRLQRGLQVSDDKIMELLHRNHAHWAHS